MKKQKAVLYRKVVQSTSSGAEISPEAYCSLLSLSLIHSSLVPTNALNCVERSRKLELTLRGPLHGSVTPSNRKGRCRLSQLPATLDGLNSERPLCPPSVPCEAHGGDRHLGLTPLVKWSGEGRDGQEQMARNEWEIGGVVISGYFQG